MHLGEVGELGEGVLVAKGHVDDAVVGECGQGRQGGGLLAAAQAARADEEAGHLAVVAARLPLAARLVPEGLPLRREVAVPRGDADEEAVVPGQHGRVVEHLDVGGLGGRVHLGQDLLGQRLGDLVEVGGAAGVVDALQLGVG